MSSKAFAWFVAVLALFCAVTIAGIGNGWFGKRVRNPRLAQQKALQPAINETSSRDPNVAPGPGMTKVGGVWRPISDVKTPNRVEAVSSESAFKSAGSTPLVDIDDNASTKVVANALAVVDQEQEVADEKARVKKHLSVLHQSDPFDREAYLSDPTNYLNDVQPGRIWQSLPEGPDVQPIQRIGSFYRRMVQGESAQLQVLAEPGLPVTFYSYNLGQFENKLTTITVAADEKGVATATYTATTGTRGDVTIVAASPVNSQQATFTINVAIVPRTNSDGAVSGAGR